ncbi:M20 aminoacylase family protein [Sediminicoccus rosea]|uniref:M20 aminoacylase family protein n=1 Tax=Sediminicoccus rosea TaxID=1225128 RepID=A0ABZ0PK10_9PROT|nr:M20 aminoacylase family protein [Sediminicoccus rosea]WPB85596.1 M20 aminoacylase family protein [Sediminicoccus rosea]
MSTPTEIIAQWQDEFTAIRRDIHAHPELGLEEHRTADLVARKLTEMGIEVHRGVGVTGVVGVIRNGNGQGRIGLRADMDALAMTEANGFAHASTIPGKMHACGHDGHTTMLLAAAKYLQTTKRFDGAIHLIFQPGEEGAGGALAMLEDGLFERFPCDAVFGLHNRPGMPVGHYGIRPGPMMAGVAFYDIQVTGKGGHGARPETTNDPVVMGAAIVQALQSVVARNVPAAERAVLSVTRFDAGNAYNVIPNEVRLGGTVRAFSNEIMKLVEDRMRAISEGVATGLGGSAVLDFRVITTPLVNDAMEAVALGDAAASLVGEGHVKREFPAVMGGEDFAYMLEKCPGAYIVTGNGDSAEVHNPRFDFNDAAIPHGAGVLAAVVEAKLKRVE